MSEAGVHLQAQDNFASSHKSCFISDSSKVLQSAGYQRAKGLIGDIRYKYLLVGYCSENMSWKVVGSNPEADNIFFRVKSLLKLKLILVRNLEMKQVTRI